MLLETVIFAMIVPISVSSIEDKETNKALSNLSLAYYKYAEYDIKIKTLEERYLSRQVREIGSILIWVNTVVTEKQINYTWRF